MMHINWNKLARTLWLQLELALCMCGTEKMCYSSVLAQEWGG